MSNENQKNEEQIKPQAKLEDLPVSEQQTEQIKGGLVIDNGSGMSHH